MSFNSLHQLAGTLKNWGSGLKAFLLTRHVKWGTDNRCDIKCDLSDRNTFFAWQRNHMANERTFLAWCRTGISLIVFGFVIERFDLFLRQMNSVTPGAPAFKHAGGSQYLGLVTFVLGSFIIVLAGWRFFYIRKHINEGSTDFSVMPDVFLMVSILATILMIVVLFVFLFS